MKIDVLLEPDQTPAQLTELAVLCDRYGIQTLWQQNYFSCRDAFLSLVPAAMASKRIRLGVCVVSPYEMHPVMMANALLTLNEYAHGRAALVIGGGGEWLARLGIPPGRRVRGVREAVEIVKGASPQKPLAYPGEIYKAWAYRPQYATDPLPLVYAGANREQMINGTAPSADGVMFSDMPRPHIGNTVRQVRDALAKRNRPADAYRISNIWAWHIKADREAAEREARREVLLRGLLEPWYLESFMSKEDCDFIQKNKAPFYKAYRARSHVIEGIPERYVNLLIDHLTFTGTVAEIERKLPELEAFQNAGVNEICFRLHDNPGEAIRLIGEHVVPAICR
jgi:alkanesulfonate monooxygenase SsuD/methylene tetrahydromethanopterin reductase-like flavin-dependent oxidoreductase (luciferase family)